MLQPPYRMQRKRRARRRCRVLHFRAGQHDRRPIFAYLLTVNEELRAFIGKPLDFGTRHDAPSTEFHGSNFSFGQQTVKMSSRNRQQPTRLDDRVRKRRFRTLGLQRFHAHSFAQVDTATHAKPWTPACPVSYYSSSTAKCADTPVSCVSFCGGRRGAHR